MEQLKGNGYVVSFVGREAGRALFVGLFAIGALPIIADKQLSVRLEAISLCLFI